MSNTTSSIADQLSVPRSLRSAWWYRRIQSKMRRKAVRKRVLRAGLLLINVIVLAVILTVVLQASQDRATAKTTALNATPLSSTAAAANPVDQLSSANIALTVARLSSLPETTAITNQADSQATQLTMAPTNDSILAKTQVVNTALKSRADIITYVTQPGDTLSSLAAKFGVTTDSIRWSNSLVGDSVSAGMKLNVLPGVNGIIYTVKAGDTPDSLATKFKANKDLITAYNDAELNGLTPGEQIIIPGGSRVAAAPVVSYAVTGFAWGFSPLYGGNGYDYGYCTWWAAQRRMQIGKPVPTNLGDAWSWKYRAPSAGLTVSSTPVAGAVIWFDMAYPGHVGFVESVSGGSITISEMNYQGWGVTDTRVLPASGPYSFIN